MKKGKDQYMKMKKKEEDISICIFKNPSIIAIRREENRNPKPTTLPLHVSGKP